MRKIWKVLAGVGLGVVEGFVPIRQIQANLQSETPEPGKIDWARLFGGLIAFAVVLAFIFGKITLQDLDGIFERLSDFGLWD